MSLKKQPKATKPAARKLKWRKGQITSGPFAGTVWGAKLGETFLMIVRREPHGRGNPDAFYFELWTDGIVHDETKSKTLAEAQAFAEASLGNILSGKFPATKKAAKKAA